MKEFPESVQDINKSKEYRIGIMKISEKSSLILNDKRISRICSGCQ